jgi:hypothetical protein
MTQNCKSILVQTKSHSCFFNINLSAEDDRGVHETMEGTILFLVTGIGQELKLIRMNRLDCRVNLTWRITVPFFVSLQVY